MRRMYSEKELTTIIKQVSEAYIDELIEDGVFNTKINEYVDAYLDENPITPSDLDFSSIDFVAKTLEQTEANASYDINIQSTPTGFSVDVIFKRLIVVGNVLKMIAVYKVTNTGEDSASMPDLTFATNQLASKYKSKIVDYEGLTLAQTQATSHPCSIRNGTCTISTTISGGTYAIGFANLYRYEGAIYIRIGSIGSLSMAGGSSRYVSSEIELALL